VGKGSAWGGRRDQGEQGPFWDGYILNLSIYNYAAAPSEKLQLDGSDKFAKSKSTEDIG
jgi:hypothetical protein